MAYVGENPNFKSTILDNKGVGGVSNPPTGKIRIINRDGILFIQDDAGAETEVGAGGGLTPEVQDVNFTAESGKHYLITENVTAVTLPAMTAETKLDFTPIRDADWNLANVTFTRDGTDTIEGDTTYIADVNGVDRLSFLPDFGNTNWEVASTLSPGGAGGSGGGGLTVVFASTNFTASAGNHYRCTSAVTAVQMPAVADGSRVAFSPSEGAEWSSNSITITPSAGETIDEDNGAVADETYILNLSGVDKVEMTGKLSTTNWEVDTPVTPSSIGNGAFVGEWESYTPTVTNNFPTGKTILFKKMRVGSNLYVRYQIPSGGVSGAAGQMQFDLPDGHTADSSQITVANGQGGFFGHGAWDQGAVDKPCVGAWVSSTRIAMYKLEDGVNQALNGGSIQTRPSTFESGPIPIVEFANTGTTLTVSDFSAKTKVFTPTFSSTPAGWSLIGATMMFYRDSDDNYRARFNVLADHTSAGQVGFRFTELDSVGVLPFNQACTARPRSNTSASMAVIDTNGNVTTTHITANDDLINVAGDVLLSGKPTDFDDHAENNFNIDVHFQEATSATSGLMPAISDGTSAALAGQVGEYIESLETTGIALALATPTTITSIVLTPGDWDIWGAVESQGVSLISGTDVGISTVTNNMGTAIINHTRNRYDGAGFSFDTNFAERRQVLVTSTTTYYLVANRQIGTSTTRGRLAARRMR